LHESNGYFIFKENYFGAGRWINYIVTGILLTDTHNGLRIGGFARCTLLSAGDGHASEILQVVKKKIPSVQRSTGSIRYTEYSKRNRQEY
jgi:hypothetical protein